MRGTDSTPYRLVTPCSNCPFRTGDEAVRLSRDRAQGIADYLRSNQGDFHCHKTIDVDESGAPEIAAKTATCAGALVVLEKEGTSTQRMRVAEALGLYDPARLRHDAPVFDTLDAWVDANEF